MTAARCVTLAATLIVTACGRGRQPSQEQLPQWRLVPVATLAPPVESGWMRLKAVVADRDGNAYVLDEGAPQIRVFDSAGDVLRTIGRRGAGPVEFAAAYGMGLGWLGDTLVVLDPGNGRLTRLDRDGTWIGSWRVQRITGPGVQLRQAAPDAVYAVGSQRADTVSRSVLIRYTAAGPRGTLPEPDGSGNVPTGIECVVNDGIRFADIPYAARTLWTAGPDGELVAANTGAYRIAFINGRGDTARIVARPVEPIPVSDAEWTAGLADYRAIREQNPSAECRPSSPTRVRVKPVLRGFEFDDRGELWVERLTRAGYVFDVFDRVGHPLGTMEVPAHDELIPPYVRGDRLYVIDIDESSGLQSVRVYRVVRPAASPVSAPR